jgi:DNA polymerase-3 subunit delta
MGALTFDALLRSLKRGAPDPVYYLHGDEDVLKDEAIRALLDRALEPSARDFNIDQRGAAELDPESFSVLVNTAPLLTTTRAVVLRGIEQIRKTSRLYKELLHYLEAPNPSTLLVLVQGAGADDKPDAALLRRATAVEAERLPPDRVLRWVAHRAGELGLALEDDATPLLLEAVGPDLGALARELDKLAAATAGRQASAADVAALVGLRRGETLADLVAAALEHRPAAAASLVEPVLEQAGMTGVRIVTALGTALVGTALGRAELDGGVAAGRLPDVLFRHFLTARPFGLGNWKEEAARWARWATRWSAAALRHALRQALAADRALKSTTVSDERGTVTQLVLTLAVPMEEAA